MRVHIIGGGIIGLSAAWYLRKEGFEVTVIDAQDLKEGTSHGNAGMIVPSHFIPLAAPGVIAKGIKWMFSRKSPFYIKPRLSLELVEWLWTFYRSCSHAHVERAMPVLRDYNLWSRQLYSELASHPEFRFCFEQKGILMLFKEAKTEAEEFELADQAAELGLEAQKLSAAATQALEPGLRLDVRGSVYFPGDAHLYPNLLIRQLTTALKSQGVEFLTGAAVTDFDTVNGKISRLQLSTGQVVPIEKVVLAAGSWSAGLMKKLGLKLLLQDGKGYSVTLSSPEKRPGIPALLSEAKVAVTPMGDDLRIGGTLEISNFSPQVDRLRFQGIMESLPRYYPELNSGWQDLSKVWHGYRPCSPDGLPYMGFSKKHDNLLVATGHAMMGLSLGPATGRMVADLMIGKQPEVKLDLFDPARF